MTAIAHITRRDIVGKRLAVLLSLIVTIIISVWLASADGDGRYALYSLPPIILLTCAAVAGWRIEIDRNGFAAFLIYGVVAATSAIYSPYSGSFATRDLLIISSYLLLFAILFRAPAFLADTCMASLAFASVVVALANGVSLDVDLLNSGGILESVLAFPLGIVLLYYAGTGQWARAALAFLFFFLAFKRIAILGAVLILCLEFMLLFLTRRRIGRCLALLIVVAVSILALLLLQIFDYISVLLDNERLSAGSISLGRSDFAAILWQQILNSGFGHALLGFGPGAADYALQLAGEEIVNPHNDWLKIAFDYGIVGFLAFHAILFLIHPNTPLGNRLYIYVAVLMATDNVLIYVFYFVYLFLILRIAPPGHTAPLRAPDGGSSVLIRQPLQQGWTAR